ncbi:MAG TPA: porin, partial [Hyphomicrobiaceae bacterium]|nr:porin [Hyphomicrobiaceae bacterium]
MFHRTLSCAAALASFVAWTIPTPASAADLGGDCCADLEERIADLEATTARKGNRKVSLTVSGQVNHAVVFWDDGRENNVYVV